MRTQYPHLIRFTLLLLLGLFLSACSNSENPTSNIGTYDNLVIKIEVDRWWAKVGEPVHIRLTTINDGQQPYVFDSKDKPVLDIIVREPATDKILLSWAAQNPDKAMNHLEWQPGESKVMEMTWIPPEEEYGRAPGISGLLSINSKTVYGVSILFKVGYPGGP